MRCKSFLIALLAAAFVHGAGAAPSALSQLPDDTA